MLTRAYIREEKWLLEDTDMSRLSASHSDIKWLFTAFYVHQTVFKCIQVNMKKKKPHKVDEKQASERAQPGLF